MRTHDPKIALAAILGFCTLVGLGALVALALEEYDSTIAEARRAAEAQVRVVEEHTTLTIKGSDLVLQHAAARFDDFLSGSDDARRLLHELAWGLPRDGALWVFDETGQARLSTSSGPIDAVKAHSEYFGPHRDGVKFFVGSPITSATGKRLFTISRRVERNGRFAGIICAAIYTDYYSQFYLRQNLSPGSVLSILRDDGQILVREPSGGGRGGRVPATFPGLQAGTDPKLFFFRSPLDGEERAMAAIHIAGYPLIAATGISLADELATWQRRTMTNTLFAAAALVALYVIGYLAFRTLGREQASARALAAALEQNRLLLREVNHRTKNNLQLVLTIVRIAQREAGDDARPFIEAAAGRIRSIALVHDLLSRFDKADEVDCAAYLRALSEALVPSSGAAGRRVTLTFEADQIILPLIIAQSLGIILNEVLTNALKHAFKGRDLGHIDVRLRREQGNEITLVVADNGIGMPAVSSRKSIGLTLIEQLGRQIGATYAFEADRGTRFRLSFTLPSNIDRNRAVA